jgi:RNA polymerase sigma-70 factor (ECF subfamily)
MAETLSDETAKTMRRLWFDYLDTIEPVRSKLHAYCLQLTGSAFDAEDLVQETLVRTFGVLGRGDLGMGPNIIRNSRAYLSRIATNLWIDTQRRRAHDESDEAGDVRLAASREPAVVTPASAAALFARTAPQERAAVVLKDVFDFSLDEIAEILSTSVGAVKAALHRGRGKLAERRQAATPPRGTPAARDLIDRFIAAFNARDIKAVTALLSDTVIYEARGVGGEMGHGATWVAVNVERPPGVVSERHVFEGEDIVVGVIDRGRGKVLLGVSRLEEADGLVSRHVGYFFTPETLALVADALGMRPANHGYHQEPETLEQMIAGTRLPWREI